MSQSKQLPDRLQARMGASVSRSSTSGMWPGSMVNILYTTKPAELLRNGVVFLVSLRRKYFVSSATQEYPKTERIEQSQTSVHMASNYPYSPT